VGLGVSVGLGVFVGFGVSVGLGAATVAVVATTGGGVLVACGVVPLPKSELKMPQMSNKASKPPQPIRSLPLVPDSQSCVRRCIVCFSFRRAWLCEVPLKSQVAAHIAPVPYLVHRHKWRIVVHVVDHMVVAHSLQLLAASRASRAACRLLPVSLPSVPHSPNPDGLRSIVNAVEHSIIAYPYPIGILRTAQLRAPRRARILTQGSQRLQHPAQGVPRQAVKVLLRPAVKIYPVQLRPAWLCILQGLPQAQGFAAPRSLQEHPQGPPVSG